MLLTDYTTVIWDWNGTIIDDVQLCYDIYMEQRELWDLAAMDLDAYRYHFRFPVHDFYIHAGFKGDSAEYDALAKLFITRYNEKRYTAPVHEGAQEVLNFCKEKGITSYVLSAYESTSLIDMVAAMGFGSYFKELFGLSGVRAGSKIESGKVLLEKNRIDPERALYIGDTVHDYEVAQSLGVDVVLMTKGHNSRRCLKEKCPSIPLLDSLLELLPD